VFYYIVPIVFDFGFGGSGHFWFLFRLFRSGCFGFYNMPHQAPGRNKWQKFSPWLFVLEQYAEFDLLFVLQS
jgi:hypothetical protein